MEQKQQELDRRLPVYFGNKELQDDSHGDREEAEEGVDEFQRTVENRGKLHDNFEIKSIRAKLQRIEHPRVPNLPLFYKKTETLQGHRVIQAQTKEKHNNIGIRIRVEQQTVDQHSAVLRVQRFRFERVFSRKDCRLLCV